MLARDISAEVWLSDGDWDRIDFLERVLEEGLTRDGWELQFAVEFQRSPRPLTPEQRLAVDRMRTRIGREQAERQEVEAGGR